MANAVYPKGLAAFMSGSINLTTDTIKCVLLTSSYSYSAAHQVLSDLTGTVATSGALTGKSVTGGVFVATIPPFVGLTGSTVARVVFYKDTGSSSTSPLISYHDTKSDTTAISYTPNSSDLTITDTSICTI